MGLEAALALRSVFQKVGLPVVALRGAAGEPVRVAYACVIQEVALLPERVQFVEAQAQPPPNQAQHLQPRVELVRLAFPLTFAEVDLNAKMLKVK